jgi:hypothetical protein
MDEAGVLRSFVGRVQGDRIEGSVTGPQGRTGAFTAVRNGPPPPIRGTSD